jgi:hypothetical protein
MITSLANAVRSLIYLEERLKAQNDTVSLQLTNDIKSSLRRAAREHNLAIEALHRNHNVELEEAIFGSINDSLPLQRDVDLENEVTRIVAGF